MAKKRGKGSGKKEGHVNVKHSVKTAKKASNASVKRSVKKSHGAVKHRRSTKKTGSRHHQTKHISSVKSYVKKALEHFDEETVRKKLEKVGWKKAIIDKAIRELKYESEKEQKKKSLEKVSKKIVKETGKKGEGIISEDKAITKVIESYDFLCNDMPITTKICEKSGEYVQCYDISISSIGATTEMVLEKIREELVRRVNLGMVDITDPKRKTIIEERFSETIRDLIIKYFPEADENTVRFLTSYLIQKSLGMGEIEILNHDKFLEEVVINSSDEPVWVYHRRHGWLKTNIYVKDEDKTRHYATMIGRKVGRQISILTPLLDANLDEGDRVNATLNPISTKGNTITLRRFSRDPLTITHFIENNTISLGAAAMAWLGIQFELSAIIAGGTASGKTSTLNVLASFFPPNQRIISIEDTRELNLPRYLHWVPMSTRLPNPEGRGEVTMEDLLVNSLRMRPDRIVVGEVRRQQEAETLFEAIHTGHSCYATFHANNVDETIRRMTNEPINVPKIMLPAVSMIMVQFRNRRTNTRRTFQIAEILPDSETNILMQYDGKKDVLRQVNKSKSLMDTLELYTGFSYKEIAKILKEKESILKYMVRHQVKTIDDVGRIVAEYYTNKDNLMKFVRKNRKFL
ncbi:Flp pilus assembly complex ATPase component TadA [Candidatus Woesearchaeota archaeon]|nr:Flp pilus assembly complex ATPase component TadA [Candidatus Woesearchaeota archaeon]